MTQQTERLMVGKTCLVTGSSRGIGYHTARKLALQGARVIVVGHHRERGEKAVERISEVAGPGSVDLYVADLSSQAEVRELAEWTTDRYPRLDALVNNVGGFFPRREETVDGIEMTLALNHLSYFLLTNLLLENLKRSAPARIVNVSSDQHRRVNIDFDDLQLEESYSGVRAYAQSKLANVMFTYELAERLEGMGVTANAVHPGFVGSHLYRHIPLAQPLVRFAARLFGKTPEEGAEGSVYLASSPAVAGLSGRYFVAQEQVPPSDAAHDKQARVRLWKASQDLVAGASEPIADGPRASGTTAGIAADQYVLAENHES